jgi:hypothetical protein
VSNQKHNITALFEQAQFVSHCLRPIFPADRKECLHPLTMPRQKHIYCDDVVSIENTLQFGHIVSAAIKAVDEQYADYRLR